MTRTTTAHWRNTLLWWIYCWMATWTIAALCSFRTLLTLLMMIIKLAKTVIDQTVKYLLCLLSFFGLFSTVVSSDPAIECLSFLESRLQETNNLSVFLANVRKEFISLARRWDWEKWFRRRSAQSAQTGQIQVTATQNINLFLQTKLINICGLETLFSWYWE